MSRRSVILLWTPLPAQARALTGVLSGVAGTEFVVADSEAAALAQLPHVDAALLVGNESGFTTALAAAVREAPALRWLQILSTGLDGVERHGVPHHITVTGIGDAYAPVVAEHAMALLLALARRLNEAAIIGASGEWSRSMASRSMSLEAKTLCIAGLGRIGQEVARRASAFGMTCIAINRSGKNPAPQWVRHVHLLTDLDAVLAQSDAVIVALPLTGDTRRCFGVGQWNACKPGALIVNIGRGGLIDSDSLVAALNAGKLGGAGLDVTDPEPLPSGHPLWSLPNVLVTPHMGGGGSPPALDRLVSVVTENIRRFIQGEALLNIVRIHC